MKNLELRLERPADRRAVEELTREAFWGLHGPACDEHLLAHKLRGTSAFVPELNYVALTEGKLVGSIMYTKSRVAEGVQEIETLTFGPLSVLPDYQGRGIGGALVLRTLSEARELGLRAVLIFGHPDYYVRFGFQNAAAYRITTEEGENFDAFMALPLYPGALDGVSGRFFYDPVFHIDPSEARDFDRGFPPKEPCAPVPLDALLEKLAAPARRALAERKLATVWDLERFSRRELASWYGVGPTALRVISDFLHAHRPR